ncbi:MAG: TRAP transporter small permease [Rhodobacterales bacterium]|nr:TRAP transporter small permease [Rhodobacterales bacterium]MDX5412467.1 TRAP transporter small permease [Rhodobacterales bacterium]
MGGRLWSIVERMLEALMAAFLLAMALITGADVVGRYFLNAPIPGGYEIVQYLMALSVFAALPLATRADGHLTISLFTDRLQGRRKRVHRVVVLLVSSMTLAFLAWRMGEQAAVLARRQMTSGSLGLPLAPIAWTMTALAWLSVVVSVALIIEAVTGRETARIRRGEDVG